MSRQTIFLLISILFCIMPAATFELANSQLNACNQPKIIEYLNNYVMPTNDLKNLIASNISSLPLSDIKAKNISFSKINCHLSYINSQSISARTPLQYAVSDHFSIQLNWVANVSKLIGHDSFNVSAEVASINVTYTKMYSEVEKKFTIKDLKYNLIGSQIVQKSIVPTPKAAEKTKIQATMSNELFNSLNTQLQSLSPWLNDAVSKQKISQIYDSDRYDYDYYGWKASINTQSLTVTAQDNNILNGYNGDIVGVTSDCPKGLPTPQTNHKQFFSMAFINAFAKNVINNYAPYKNVLINSTSVRTDGFQFKLIDLQFGLSGLFPKYAEHYMKPISFACKIKEQVSSFIKENSLYQLLVWSCSGYLWTSNTTSAQILDSQISTSHKIEFRVNSNSISAYSNVIKVVGTKYNPVGDIGVRDQILLGFYIEQFLNDMRVYVPGTYFQVSKGSSLIELVSDEKDLNTGIWIS